MFRTSVSSRRRHRLTTALLWAAIGLWSVAAIAGLSACSSDGSGGATTSSSSSMPLSSPVTAVGSASTSVFPTTDTPVTTTTAPAVAPTDAAPTGVDLSRCTNQTNYAGDPRSNAEINSIGERTGTCPPVLTAASTR